MRLTSCLYTLWLPYMVGAWCVWLSFPPVSFAEVSKYDATRMKIATVENAVRLYVVNHGQLPAMTHWIETLSQSSSGTPYLKTAPRDSWGEMLIYRRLASDDPYAFTVFSKGRDRVEGTLCDVYNTSIQGLVLEPCVEHSNTTLRRYILMAMLFSGLGLILMVVLWKSRTAQDLIKD